MMKKIILSLLMFLTVPSIAQRLSERGCQLPQRGYKGEAGLAVGVPVSERGISPVIDFSTLHGYQFNSRLFLGVGLSTINTEFLDLYLELRGNLRKPTVGRPSYPFLSFKAGYSVSTWIGEKFADQRGVVVEPRFGWSFYSKAGHLRYNAFCSMEVFSYTLIPKIGIAFEF